MTGVAGGFPWSDAELDRRVREAVRALWSTRAEQAARQASSGKTDAGNRGTATGGRHMDAFAQILADLALHAGFGSDEIHTGAGAQLPGFYRPSKQWDLIAVRGGQLCAAVELKSMAGSYRNNLNSRTEEALGSAADVRAAKEKGMLGIQPLWLGYLFVMREENVSLARRPAPAAVLATDPVFAETSYVDRCGILCERMVRDGLYTSASFLTAPLREDGEYAEPREAVRFSRFARSFHEHLLAC